jgi:hypothetical protein
MIKAKVAFDILDKTIEQDTTNTSVTSEFTLSVASQLMDRKRENTYNLATLETNRFKLDGSFSFADDNMANNQHVGWVSSVLSNGSRIFSPNQIITFTFGTTHTTAGITVIWDPINSEYATDYDIKAYNAANVLLVTKTVVDNNQAISVVDADFTNFKKIEIVVKKWSKSYRRARATEVVFGISKVFSDDNLIHVSLVEETDLTSGTMPSSELKVTVDNSNREFNILNPVGLYKNLQERQNISLELGVVANGTTEYIPVGTYMLRDWISDEGALTTTFTARTILEQLDEYEYENLSPKSDYTLYDLALEIMAKCNISDYSIDTYLQGFTTNALVQKTKCKNVLQMVAIAGCCNLFVNRGNKIVIKRTPVLTQYVDTITLDNMYTEPQIKLEKSVNTVIVQYFTNLTTFNEVTENGMYASGDSLRLENNTLINSAVQAIIVAKWLLQVKNNRALFTMNWRGNPAHDPVDVLAIQNTFGSNMSAIITKQDLSYEGYLTVKTELRGSTRAWSG